MRGVCPNKWSESLRNHRARTSWSAGVRALHWPCEATGPGVSSSRSRTQSSDSCYSVGGINCTFDNFPNSSFLDPNEHAARQGETRRSTRKSRINMFSGSLGLSTRELTNVGLVVKGNKRRHAYQTRSNASADLRERTESKGSLSLSEWVWWAWLKRPGQQRHAL